MALGSSEGGQSLPENGPPGPALGKPGSIQLCRSPCLAQSSSAHGAFSLLSLLPEVLYVLPTSLWEGAPGPPAGVISPHSTLLVSSVALRTLWSLISYCGSVWDFLTPPPDCLLPESRSSSPVYLDTLDLWEEFLDKEMNASNK